MEDAAWWNRQMAQMAAQVSGALAELRLHPQDHETAYERMFENLRSFGEAYLERFGEKPLRDLFEQAEKEMGDKDVKWIGRLVRAWEGLAGIHP